MTTYKLGDIYLDFASLTPLPEGKTWKELGYSEDTLLVVINPSIGNRGTIVKLFKDDGSLCPYYTKEGLFSLNYFYSDKLALLPQSPQTPQTIIQKLFKKKHTYTTTLTRDDGVIFTQDAIDGVTIEALTNEEQEHYKQAKAIRAKLNAHRNLTF